MSFKSKMRKRGINKIDSLVETPESITLVTPKKNFNPKWLTILVPIAASIVVVTAIVLPIAFNMNKMGGSESQIDKSDNQGEEGWYSGDDSPGSNNGGAVDQDASESPLSTLYYNGVYYSLINPQESVVNIYKNYLRLDLSNPSTDYLGDKITDINSSINPLLGEIGGYSLYHVKNSNSNGVLVANNGETTYFYFAEPYIALPVDASLTDILTFYGIDNYQFIEAYESETINDKVSLYSKLTYTFDNYDSTSIINSLKVLPSNFASVEERNANYVRDDLGIPKGVNYLFVVSDGLDCLPLYYCSQSCDITVCRSNFVLKNSDAFSLMDSRIEMDYNPDYHY